ncbi:MAG: hypothetical protein AAF202_05215 [Pseudomonadota bacterium]
MPNTYSRDQETLVTIYDERGKEVFSQTNLANSCADFSGEHWQRGCGS